MTLGQEAKASLASQHSIKFTWFNTNDNQAKEEKILQKITLELPDGNTHYLLKITSTNVIIDITGISDQIIQEKMPEILQKNSLSEKTYALMVVDNEQQRAIKYYRQIDQKINQARLENGFKPTSDKEVNCKLKGGFHVRKS